MNPEPADSTSTALSLPGTAEELLPLVYEELRRLAGQRMAAQAPGQTLQATALVHEAWIRLHGGEGGQWNDRAHFFRAAAEAMRHILIDAARSKGRQKRDGGQRIDLTSLDLATDAEPEALLVLHEALEYLAALDGAKAELVKLRFFTGLTLEESAEVLGLPLATAKRAWSFARAWLFREIKRLQAGT
jgi:RNA polymerase sigma factor (TIGR02999 family)